jgi:hypothetical protein
MKVNCQFRGPAILARAVIPSVSRYSCVGGKIIFNVFFPVIETLPSSGTEPTEIHNGFRNLGAVLS